MRESTFWRTPRFCIVIAVTVLHMALIALLWMWGAAYRVTAPAYEPLQLVYLPRVPPLPVRAETGRPLRLRADLAFSPVSPLIATQPPASNSTGTGTHGQGVDWMAEAHRAVKAFEIRRDQPDGNSLSGKSPANDWWPQQGPHAGDEYKTDTGDWIIWIDSNCYKIASWHSADPVANSQPARIVCPKKSAAP